MPAAMSQVLILPGWGGPRPGHWSSDWPGRHGYESLLQHDWQRPLRGDWLMVLEEAVLARSGPVVLAADGLACHLVAAWAAHSAQVRQVRGALLAEPLALETELLRTRLPSWSSPVLEGLPFPCVVAAGPNTSRAWAQAWGADHAADLLPQASRDPAWPEGHALLRKFFKD